MYIYNPYNIGPIDIGDPYRIKSVVLNDKYGREICLKTMRCLQKIELKDKKLKTITFCCHQ